MSAPVIQVRNLSKRYRLGSIGLGSLVDDAKRLGRKCGLPLPPPDPSKEFLALDDVSFSVEEGEVLGIIGPNGAGKSTLLKILSRITEPTSGQATLRGRVASLLEVGTGFHGDMTGRENVYLNGALYGLSRKEIQGTLDSIVDFAQVQEFIDTPVKRYSSGMYVRLAFAVAAHLRPEILIVDEVLAVGDAGFKSKCTQKLKEAAREGRTSLFVSHNHELLQALCPRSILLRQGKLIAAGPTDELLAQYLAKDNRSASVDLKDMDCLHSSEEASFESIAINSQREQDGTEFLLGETLTIRLAARLNKELSSGVVSFGIHTPDGRQAAWACSYDDTGRFTTFPKGKNLIQITLPPLLLPGDYYLSVNLCKDNGDALCAIENALAFHVSRLPVDDRPPYNWTKVHAPCHARPEWEFPSNAKLS